MGIADMSACGLPSDYLLQREAIVREMTVERIAALAQAHLDPERMIWLVVGDAETHEVIASQPLPVELRGAVHTSLVSPDGRYVYIVGPRPSGDERERG